MWSPLISRSTGNAEPGLAAVPGTCHDGRVLDPQVTVPRTQPATGDTNEGTWGRNRRGRDHLADRWPYWAAAESAVGVGLRTVAFLAGLHPARLRTIPGVAAAIGRHRCTPWPRMGQCPTMGYTAAVPEPFGISAASSLHGLEGPPGATGSASSSPASTRDRVSVNTERTIMATLATSIAAAMG